MNTRMLNLGFTESHMQEAAHYQDMHPGRVITQSKELYRVATAEAELLAEVSGKLRHQARMPADFPTVGDFVMVDRADNSTGNAVIHQILRRSSFFERRAAGAGNDSQPIASNIDTVFICMALNSDFNLRRLERYLSITWAGGAVPVVVLTKADLCADLDAHLQEVNSVAIGVDIIATTSLTETGFMPLSSYIKPGRTVAFIGSSGVGKSTLINRMLGEELIATQATRKDDKGRHTTTRRELIVMPTGGAVIDTPGMRELGVESADLAKTFADIELLASNCRFTDCTHTSEPHCAVLEAIKSGSLSEKRLENYRKLQKEAHYEGLNAKQIEKEKTDKMFAGFGGMKNARNYIKSKTKRGPYS